MLSRCYLLNHFSVHWLWHKIVLRLGWPCQVVNKRTLTFRRPYNLYLLREISARHACIHWIIGFYTTICVFYGGCYTFSSTSCSGHCDFVRSDRRNEHDSRASCQTSSTRFGHSMSRRKPQNRWSRSPGYLITWCSTGISKPVVRLAISSNPRLAMLAIHILNQFRYIWDFNPKSMQL